jgi:hypothetical protein
MEFNGLAIDPNLACGRRVQAVQDVHQGGLACPVLAEEGHRLTFGDGEVHIVIRKDTRELLGDAAQLKCHVRLQRP